jgi:hypothetical protein
MKINDEAIYGTTFIKPYKEGKMVFTKKDNAVYVIYLADANELKMPGSLTINSFPASKSTSIYLLGYDKPLAFKKSAAGGLQLVIPAKIQANPPSQHAWVFKISGQ